MTIRRPIAFFTISIILFYLACQIEAQHKNGGPYFINNNTSGPVTVNLDESFDKKGSYELCIVDSDKCYPLQQMAGSTFVTILPFESEEVEDSRFEVREAMLAQRKTGVQILQNEDSIYVRIGQQKILSYVKSTQLPPRGEADHFKRSGFIHPLYSPSGKSLTDGFPRGHTHQHGLFFAWVKTVFRGRNVDFWNQQDLTGSIRHISVGEITEGPVFSSFNVNLEHIAIQGTDTTAAIDESWSVRVYAQSDPVFIDIQSIQECSGKDTLHILEYHYGGLGIRGSDEWNDIDFKQTEVPPFVNSIGLRGKGGFLTSTGEERVQANHSRPEWVDFFGQVEGMPVGLIVMGQQSNFRSNQPVRIHPVMPYFCFAPVVLGGFDIVPGQPYQSQYRIILHGAQPESQQVDKWYDSYQSELVIQN